MSTVFREEKNSRNVKNMMSREYGGTQKHTSAVALALSAWNFRQSGPSPDGRPANTRTSASWTVNATAAARTTLKEEKAKEQTRARRPPLFISRFEILPFPASRALGICDRILVRRGGPGRSLHAQALKNLFLDHQRSEGAGS